MSVNQDTVQVSYRLSRRLVERLKRATSESRNTWPPPPTQTDVVTHGIELVLAKLERENETARKNR